MDIIDAMDVQNWTTFSIIGLWAEHMFRKPCKAHRHILLILQNIERRDLITLWFGPPLGVRFVEGFIHFYFKKLESKILQKKKLGYFWSSIVLKTGPTFRWMCQLNMSVKWSIQIEKNGSAYIYLIYLSVCL